jgi:DNA-binding NarL/FixJ family response regulator
MTTLTIHALLRSLSTANAPLLLLVVPIAVIGRRWGSWHGLAAAALAIALVATRGLIWGGQIGIVGYLSRATAFGTVANLAGRVQGRSDRGGEAAVARGAQPEDPLSPRELEVLALMAEGATNAEIAQRLFIAKSTVQSHVKSILRKLGVRNRTEAVARHLRP